MTCRRLFLMIGVCCVLQATALPAWMENVPITVRQPDGQTLNCFASGDEFFNWLHDGQKFTIIKDPSTGFYVYAIKEGEKLVPSRFVAGRVDPVTVGLTPGALIPPESMLARRQSILQEGSGKGISPIVQTPRTGNINNVVVFVRFSDEVEFIDPSSLYNTMFNAASSGTSSLRNYFWEMSYSNLTISSTFYPQPSGATVASYQDIHPRAYFQPYDAVTNPGGYQGGDNGTERAVREHALLKAAVESIASQVPVGLDLDNDADGDVDNIVFMVKGSATGWSSLLWPHMWSLFTYQVSLRGWHISRYNFQLQAMTDVGVLCHEMFHSLGAPDLYHYSDAIPNPVGSWDLMGYQTNPPQHTSAFMKMKYGSWISEIPQIIAPGVYTLSPLTSASNNSYRIASPNSSSEYFVVDYRRREGTFESRLPGEGLLVYRINTTRSGNAYGPPDELYIYRPGGTRTSNGSLNQAAFSANAGRTQINDDSDPSSFLSDGGMGGLRISEIGSTGSTISFRVSFPVVSTLTSIFPTSVNAGDPGFLLDVYGIGFEAPSVIQIDGASRVTSHWSATHLGAAILAEDISTAGPHEITVLTPGLGISNSMTLTVNQVTPGVGTLAVTVENGEDWPMIGTAEVDLYTSANEPVGSVPATISTPAVFHDVPEGAGYWYRVWYGVVPPKLWGEEYWGQKQGITITRGGTTGETFKRNTPYCPQIAVFDSATGEPIISPVMVGTPLRIALTLKNPGYAGSKNQTVKTRIVVDRDMAAAYDFMDSTAYQMLDTGATVVHMYSFTPRGEGLYRYNSGAVINLTGLSVACDASAWADLFEVHGWPLTITTPSPLPVGTVDAAYSSLLEASGGMPSYLWTISSGALPPGLTLALGGAIAGKPTAVGHYTFTVKVSDAATMDATKDFALDVNAAPDGALAITIRNGEDWGLQGGSVTVRLYGSSGDWVAATSMTGDSNVTFHGVKPGQGYWYRVWYNESPQKVLGEEYWGQKDGIVVTSGETTREVFMRNAPYVIWVKVFDELNQHEVTGPVPVGISLRVVVNAKNPPVPGSRSHMTASRLLLDNDVVPPYLFADSTSFQVLNPDSESQISFAFTPRTAGIYMSLAGLTTLLDGSGSVCHGRGWSTLFTTVTSPPQVPILTLPANSDSGVVIPAVLSWRASQGAETYRVQLAQNNTFSSVLADQAGVIPTTWTATNLSPGSEYFWRVNATNGDGTSAWSEVWSFVTAVGTPPAPLLASPGDGATDVLTSVTLSWNPPPGAVTYRVQLSVDTSYATCVVDDSSLSTSSLTVANLARGVTHRWRVNARNNAGTSGWSPSWSFSTMLPTPSAVALCLPVHDAIIAADSCRLLWWKGAPAVQRYEVQWGPDSTFSSGSADSSIVDTAYVTRHLANNVWLFWRVRGKNVIGWGPYSEVRKFHTLYTGVNFADGIPSITTLYQNYPNPFNPSTHIEYSLPQESRVRLEIFDVLGKKITTLVDEVRQAGRYQTLFDAGRLANGVYFYRLSAGGTSLTKPMILAK